MRRGRGAAMLEMALALALGGVLLLLMGFAVRGAARTFHAAHAAYRFHYGLLRVRRLLTQAMADLDGHPFPLLPIVHKAGMIAFRDGTLHPVLSGAHRPHAGSDALTALALQLDAAHAVLREQQETGGQLLFYACPRFAGRFRSDEYLGYLGLGLDGFWELQGEAAPHPGRPACRDFRVTAVRSMSLSPPPAAAVRIIVPIRSHYTLYVDGRGQLRWLSHRGMESAENQPLFSGIERLQLALRPLRAGISCIAAELSFAGGAPRHLLECSRLGRADPLNFLLNQP